MRETILHLLQEAQGQHISGETISNTLGISRAAVWKHVQALKKEGFIIEAVTRKGYALMGAENLLHNLVIAPLLQTALLGRELVCLKEAPSTNLIAKQLIEQGAPHGMVVLAEEQTSGRGRLGRAWKNAPGQDICMSCILMPRLETQYAFRFTLATALGVFQMVTALGLPAAIKWPNDVLVSGKKICGILLEMTGNMDALEAIVVGIGVNVNTPSFHPPIDETATSLYRALHHTVKREEVLASLLNTLEPLYNACESNTGFQELLAQYRANTATIGQEITVSGILGQLNGIAEGIDDNGQLLLRTTDGALHALAAGDVTLRRE